MVSMIISQTLASFIFLKKKVSCNGNLGRRGLLLSAMMVRLQH